MADELLNMAGATQAVERAATTFEAGKSKMFNAEGKPIYAAEHQAALMKPVMEQLQTAVGNAVVMARVNTSSAIGRREMLQNEDPARGLTPEELGAASMRAAFVKEDVERLAFPELTARIRAAVAGNDRAGLFLLKRYGEQKVEHFFQLQRAGRADPMASAGLAEAGDELRKLDAALYPAKLKGMADMERIIARANELRSYAVRTLGAADGSASQQAANFAKMVHDLH